MNENIKEKLAKIHNDFSEYFSIKGVNNKRDINDIKEPKELTKLIRESLINRSLRNTAQEVSIVAKAIEDRNATNDSLTGADRFILCRLGKVNMSHHLE